MASKQRVRAPKKRAPNPLDLGIFEIPNLDVMDENEDDLDDDSDLESELEAILSGKTGSKSQIEPPKKKKVSASPPSILSIEKMAAECIDDIGDESEDEQSLIDDPDLLNELQSLTMEEDVNTPVITESSAEKDLSLPIHEKSQTMISLLEERQKEYNAALIQARAVGDKSKERRYCRAIKTLENLIKSSKSGFNVNKEDIPPVPPTSISKQKASPPEAPHASPPSTTNIEAIPSRDEGEKKREKCMEILLSRRQKYKGKALEAKRAGEREVALEYMKIIKTLDNMIAKKETDESLIPPSPREYVEKVSSLNPSPPRETQELTHEETQTSSIEAAALSAASEPQDPTLFAAPPPPSSILEALEQRLAKYASTYAAAETESNHSKARRLQRIVKAYEKAISEYKAGKRTDFSDLPIPPGFAPIPEMTPSISQVGEKASVSPSEENKTVEGKKANVPPPKKSSQVPSKIATAQQKPKVQRNATRLVDNQLSFLLERQQQFRQQALASKKAGDINQAKEYLRMSKGLDSMIEATRCGLPINKSEIPKLPSEDFVVVDRSECISESVDADVDLYGVLLADLKKQIEMCRKNKNHFSELADIASARRFENLALESEKELSIIYKLKKASEPPPKFHYETRVFTILRVESDLNDDELELTVERGLNLPGKDSLDSYVLVELPIPSSDAPQKAKTNVVRDTTNPKFESKFKFLINRKSKTEMRRFKRHMIKLEVFSKGGFLRSDTSLGSVNIKLSDLETKCIIHDCFDVINHRKPTGGKLECKLRVRQPLVEKEIELVKEKWLVVGS